MYASKMLMEVLPNVHLLGTFVVAFTVVYRKKALYPIYIYVILNGIFSGFATWWVPWKIKDEQKTEKLFFPALFLICLFFTISPHGLPQTLSVCVDSPVGCGHASAAAYAEEGATVCLYDGLCGAWVSVRDAVCPGTGGFVRAEFSGDDRVETAPSILQIQYSSHYNTLAPPCQPLTQIPRKIKDEQKTEKYRAADHDDGGSLCVDAAFLLFI